MRDVRLSEIFQKYLFACACGLSRFRLFMTPWTVAHQAPLSVGFPRQDYWSGLPFPPPGIKPESPVSPALQADSLPAEPLEKPHLFVNLLFPPSLSSFSPFSPLSFLALSKVASQTKNLFFCLFFFGSLEQGLTSLVHLLCIIYLFQVESRFH